MSNQDVTTEICLLNISRAFAYQLMRQGEIPTVRIGNAVRVRKEDLLVYIDQNRRGFGFSSRTWPE
ncbi:MAG: helix-turn-helix domain-containing protein [Anaerolineae bacterium]|nr:helix-turn-helix domain-containing protein [Anaerolineae bacterium]